MIWVPVYPGKAIDSTNGRWTHWATIGNAIRRLYNIAKGFVVCGGTDTMAHLLAALGFMFPNVGKPIVGAGSQVPMRELGDDATNNLFFSIEAAMSDLSGSLLFFDKQLMDGRHIWKFQDRQRVAFMCPPEFVYGHLEDVLCIYAHAPERHDWITRDQLVYEPWFRDGVKVVELDPGEPSPSMLYNGRDPDCSILLVITFGAGNVRNEEIIEEDPTQIDCLWQLYQERRPVVLGSGMMDGRVDSPYVGGALAVSREEGHGNAISGGRATGPLLKVKCMRCLFLAWDEEKGCVDYDKFRTEMERNHIGELVSSRMRSAA